MPTTEHADSFSPSSRGMNIMFILRGVLTREDVAYSTSARDGVGHCSQMSSHYTSTYNSVNLLYKNSFNKISKQLRCNLLMGAQFDDSYTI